MEKLITRAAEFAHKAHEGQVRKYVAFPYIVHPKAVAETVAAVGGTEEMVAAAWLHDTVEDCAVSLDQIEDKFGWEVMGYVFFLTDKSKPSDGNRFTRKMIDMHHIRIAPAGAKTIKLADMIDNTKSIAMNDRNFFKVYAGEKIRLLEVLKEGSQELWDRAHKQVHAMIKLLEI